MANEFDRQEKVSDYDNFVSKKDSQINFNEEFQKINTTVKGIAVGRETKKAKLQSDTDSVIAELEKAQKNSNQTLGQIVLKQAANAKKVLLQQNKLLKAGYISPSEYMQILQTAKDDMANWGIANKMWSTEYDLSQTRQQLGKDGNKIASAVETNMNNAATGFNNLNDVEPFTSPSGASFMVRMVVNKETGERTMPSYDDKPENYLPMSSINSLMLYRDDGAKYNVGALVKSKTDRIGTFIKASVGGYTTLKGGGVILTEEGARQMDVFLNTDDGKSAFDALKKDTVNLILNDNLSIANVLAQQTGSDPTKKYILAGSIQEFRDAGGTDDSKWIKIDRRAVPPEFPDISDAQRKAAEDIVEREFRTQIGASSKESDLKAGQQDNASTSKIKQEDIDDAGYIGELNDVFTNPNSAKSQAIIKRLIDSRNSNIKNAEDRIRSIDIESGRIIVRRGGDLDDLVVDRIGDSGVADNDKTKDIDESLVNISTEDDIMSLIEILTPAGKTGISRGRVRDLIKTQKITLGDKLDRTLSTSVSETPLNPILITSGIGDGTKTILQTIENEVGEDVQWNTDNEIRVLLDKVLVQATSKTLKEALVKYKFPETKTAIVKGSIGEDGKFVVGNKNASSYFEIQIGGETTYIPLENAKGNTQTSTNMSRQITEAINTAIEKVNQSRQTGRGGAKAGISFLDWRKIEGNEKKSMATYKTEFGLK